MRRSDIAKLTSDLAGIGLRLVDEAHASWRSAQIQCHAALVAWLDAAPGHRAAANLVYRAALDREEAAARDLERPHGLASGSYPGVVGQGSVYA